jgi:dihydrofolate reductase
MARLIYGMLTSLDGYTEDERGAFGWGAPEDEEVHSCINELASSVGTYLYGRRMYETMVYWETADVGLATAWLFCGTLSAPTEVH